MDEVIAQSIEAEEHPDYNKNGGTRDSENSINSNILVHRFYGAITLEGKTYRVKTTMKEVESGVNTEYTYEVTNVELLPSEESSSSNGVGSVPSSNEVSYPLAKLLQNVEKSYDKGKKVLEESKKAENVAPESVEQTKESTPEQKAIAKQLVKSITKAGIEVSMDEAEMQRIINEAGYGTLQEMFVGEQTVQFLKTDSGEVYGFVKDGKMYLDQNLLNPNTTVHEYTHLWDEVVKNNNPELWKHGKELMKLTSIWNEVLNDENYADIKNNEDLVASEVLSRLTGEEAEKYFNELIEETKKSGMPMQVAETISLVDKLKRWLNQVAKFVKDTFAQWTKEEAERVSLDDLMQMPLRD